jgi:hypothetical protein
MLQTDYGGQDTITSIGESADLPVMDEGADDSEAVALALELLHTVGRVDQQEFYWQEAHYDHDSRHGRELLFLIANPEWVCATSEIVNISRSDAVDTAIKIDIDLDQITHEAFRTRTGRIWLPVTMLPPQGESTSQPRRGQPNLEPDPFATVTDAAGNLLPMLPAADLRHQMSAAMAEIIVNLAVAHWPGPAQATPPATRDERLLLSAAIYRMLRASTGQDSTPSSRAAGLRAGRRSKPVSVSTVADGVHEPTTRIVKAKEQLVRLLFAYIRLLNPGPLTQSSNTAPELSQFAPELARRAVSVLRALAESVVVVIPMDYDATPTVLTVRVPTRNLAYDTGWRLNRPGTWMIKPLGRLEIDVLLPTAEADRQLQIHLPDGVCFDEPEPADARDHDRAFPHLSIQVGRPKPFLDLAAAMDQVLGTTASSWPSALLQSFVDLAKVKAALAIEALRNYEVGRESTWLPVPVNDRSATEEARQFLKRLVSAMDQPDAVNDAGLRRLGRIWDEADASLGALFRRTSADRLSPRTLIARAPMIEDASQRAVPERAKIYVDVTVDDRDYFSVARSSTGMSLLLMGAVLSFLVGWRLVNARVTPAPEVLAIVLTLFAAIQAGRIERSDRATLRGQLSASGNWLIAASMFPAVILSVALAFSPGGWVAPAWAGGCICLQVALQSAMWRGPLAPGGSPTVGRRRIFATVSLDYHHIEVLRSDYWRTTTADALMLGRKAYGYVVWQKTDPTGQQTGSESPELTHLLTWQPSAVVADESTSVLALLHAGTLGQAVTFVVFRGRPSSDWSTAAQVRTELDLDPSRLAPMESATSMVDVFVGVRRDHLLPLRDHPAVGILHAAAHQLMVLEAQLPIPVPIEGFDDRQWARVRLALRDRDDIRRLSTFLNAVYADAVGKPVSRDCVVAVQTVPVGYPRVITPRATPSVVADQQLLLTSDLDVVNASSCATEDASDCTWRVITMCADARANIDSDIMQRLAKVRPHFQLAGFTYALLHGTALVVVLVHEPGMRGGAVGGSVRPVSPEETANLQADMRKNPALAKLQVALDEKLGRNELSPERSYPLLQVRYRWQDHPGAFLHVLGSISATLCDELPSFEPDDWSVSYARIQVVTGRMALGRVAVRLHTPAEEVADWGPRKMEEIERRVASLAAMEAVKSRVPDPGADDLQLPDDLVISIDLMRRLRSNPVSPPGDTDT